MRNKFAGLTKQEAFLRLRQYGPNEIRNVSEATPFKILIRLIKSNFVIYLLLLGAVISFFVGEAVTGYAILLVLFITITFTFIQEYRAEQAIKALRNMIVQVSIAERDGKEQEVLSRDLVPGDLLILRTGERVPADCVVVEENDLKLNESVLTGESQDVEKEAADDIKNYKDNNVIFMGSYVINGRCKAYVVHTGMNTKFGNIASMISQTEKTLPLQNKVNKLAKYMVITAVAISVLTGLLMATRVTSWSSENVSSILVLVIALAVSAFPEGLPVVLFTTLAVGATRMAKQNAIVNRMSAIETLGETTVICADKTGTITKGEMTVKKILVDDEVIDVGGAGYEAVGDFLLKGDKVNAEKNSMLQLLLRCAALCNDSKAERTGEDEEYKILGTPTDGALLVVAAKAKIFQEDLRAERIEEIPFNSERKMMSVLCRINGKNYIFAKGALEVLLDKCKYIKKREETVSFDADEKIRIGKLNQNLTKNSYRTIALAYKKVDVADREYEENNLVFLGITGIEDPPREEVAGSLVICQEAGIAVKMITGDDKETALAISREIGLSGNILEGEDLDKLTDDELSKIIKDVAIFARVRPEHKLRIVRVLKQGGEIVTMTGDGVNDAPALKEAHIGVAMGRSGTDVSRSVADLTLRDNNFATIVLAIKEGRTIFNNIRKFVGYQLSCNWAELSILLLGVILAPVFGWGVPLLLALQILFMNLVTDDLPAITLGLNNASRDVMEENPRRKVQILNKGIIIFMFFSTVLIVSFVLLSFYISFNVLHKDLVLARTTALVSLILLEIASAYNFRSYRFPVLTRSPFVNIYLFWASVISILATILIVYSPLNGVFGTAPLDVSGWIIAILAALLLFVIFDRLKSPNSKIKKLLAS